MERQTRQFSGDQRRDGRAGTRSPRLDRNGGEGWSASTKTQELERASARDVVEPEKMFHESLALEKGGERRHISAAVSRSRTIIGPPHWGQDHKEIEGSRVAGLSSPSGAGPAVAGRSGGCPANWKQRGKRAARRRGARKPKWRMRTKPGGSTCSRKRRKNSSTGRVIRRCSLP